MVIMHFKVIVFVFCDHGGFHIILGYKVVNLCGYLFSDNGVSKLINKSFKPVDLVPSLNVPAAVYDLALVIMSDDRYLCY